MRPENHFPPHRLRAESNREGPVSEGESSVPRDRVVIGVPKQKWLAYQEALSGGDIGRVSTTGRALREIRPGRFIGLSFVSGPLLSTHISLFIIIHAGRVGALLT